MGQNMQNLSPRAGAKATLEAGLHAASAFLSNIMQDDGADAELRMQTIELALEVHKYLLALGDEVEMRDDVEPSPKVAQLQDEHSGPEEF